MTSTRGSDSANVRHKKTTLHFILVPLLNQGCTFFRETYATQLLPLVSG